MDPASTMDAPPSLVLPGLFIGTIAHAKDRQLLNSLKIDCVVNCSANLPNYFEKDTTITYKRLAVNDMGGDTRLLKSLPSICQYLDAELIKGKRVFMHCYLGVSRSPSICLGYVIYSMKLTLREAIDFVQSSRAVCQPNIGFFEQLIIWEQQCLGRSSLTVKDYSKFFNVGYLNGDIEIDLADVRAIGKVKCVIS